MHSTLAPEILTSVKARYTKQLVGLEKIYDKTLLKAFELYSLSGGIDILTYHHLSQRVDDVLMNFRNETQRHLANTFVKLNSIIPQYTRHFDLKSGDIEKINKKYLIFSAMMLDKFLRSLEDILKPGFYGALFNQEVPDFPSESLMSIRQNKGRFRAKLKNLFYMLCLGYINFVFVSINKINGYESLILDLKSGPCDGLESVNGKFSIKLKRPDRAIVWNKAGDKYTGYFPPSYFGSNEIVVPSIRFETL